jgi:SRSO17 transposase
MEETWKSDLDRWLSPFVSAFRHKTRARMCPVYVAGLIGAGDRKSVQPMAARDGEVGYDQLHPFIASGVWDAARIEKALLAEADRMVGGRDAWLIVDDTGVAEGRAFGRRRAAIRLVARKDGQLSVAGLADAGVARGPGDGWPAAVPPRRLDKRSRAHGAGSRARGKTERTDEA